MGAHIRRSSMRTERYTLELVGFQPYGFYGLEEAARALSEATASLERLLPDLAKNPANGVHSLALFADESTAMPMPTARWLYKDALTGPHWRATVRALATTTEVVR